MVVDPNRLRRFERLTREVAEDERRLAEKKAQLNSLRAELLRGEPDVPAEAEPQVDPPDAKEPLKRPTTFEHLRGDILGVTTNERRMTHALAEVIKAIEELGGEATTPQLVEKLRITEGAMSVRLSRAVEQGLLKRKKPGVYVVAEEPTKKEESSA